MFTFNLVQDFCEDNSALGSKYFLPQIWGWQEVSRILKNEYLWIEKTQEIQKNESVSRHYILSYFSKVTPSFPLLITTHLYHNFLLIYELYDLMYNRKKNNPKTATTKTSLTTPNWLLAHSLFYSVIFVVIIRQGKSFECQEFEEK